MPDKINGKCGLNLKKKFALNCLQCDFIFLQCFRGGTDRTRVWKNFFQISSAENIQKSCWGFLLANIRCSLFCSRKGFLTSCHKVLEKEKWISRKWNGGTVSDRSESPALTADPRLLCDTITRFCKTLTRKQPLGMPLGFWKCLQWRHHGRLLGGDAETACVCVSVYICERGCFRVLFGLWFCYDRN